MSESGEVFHFRSMHPMEARCDFCDGSIIGSGYVYHQWQEPETRVTVSGASCDRCNDILLRGTNDLQRTVLIQNYLQKTSADPSYQTRFDKAMDRAKTNIDVLARSPGMTRVK